MTRPYYHKRQRNNNKKLAVIVGIVAVSVFALTMIWYPQISAQTNKIQSSLTSESNSIASKFSDTSSSDAQTIASQIHNLVNQQRTQHGLSSLVWNDQIAQVAKSHSDDMLSSGDVSHSGFTDRLTQMGCPLGAENIDFMQGYYSDQVASAAVTDWMNSFEHRVNMLSGKFTSEGVGVAYDGDKAIITQDFC